MGVDPHMDRSFWTAVAAGSISAALVGWLVWRYADRQLSDKLASGGSALTQQLTAGTTQLSTQALAARDRATAAVETALQERIRPQVRQEIVSTLASQGITRERVDRFVSALDRLRSLGVPV